MFNITDPNRLAMLNAGLGMMANSTGDNSGNAFGLGLQQGVNSYQNSLAQQKQEELLKKEQEMKQRQFEQQSLLRQMQIDDIVKKQQAEKAQKEALQNIFTPIQALPGKGGQVEQQGYAPPTDLQGMYGELVKTGNPELVMTGLSGLQKLKTTKQSLPTSLERNLAAYKAASPEDRKTMMSLLRNPYQDLNDKLLNTATNETIEKGLAPKDQPGYLAQKEKIKNQGKSDAAALDAAAMADDALFFTEKVRTALDRMSEDDFGPIDGRKAAFTENGQLMQGYLKNLVGNVRDKLGNGVLTDEDFKQLMAMLPQITDYKSVFTEKLATFEEEMQRRIGKGEKAKGATTDSSDPLGIRGL